jgi:hypothetical protein
MSHSGTDPVEFSPPDPEVTEKLAEYDEVGSPLALKEAADAAALHDGRAPPDPSLGLALARQRVAGWAEILERLTRDIDPEFDPETPPARGAPTKRERDATAAGREPERDHRPAGTPGQYRGDRTEPGAHRQLRQERQTVSGPFGHHRARPPIDCRRPSDAWATDRGNRGASRCRGYLRRRPHRAVGPAAMMDPSGFSTNELHKVRCFGV